MLGKSKKGTAFCIVIAILILQSQFRGVYAQDENRRFSSLLDTIDSSDSEYIFGSDPSGVRQKPQIDWQSDLDKWVTVSANLEFSHRSTNFYKSEHNTALFQGDSRIEFWMPPGRNETSWGPYLRFAGLSSSKTEAWENAWLAKPGFGVQLFPFSYRELREQEGALAYFFGPLRIFAEYNQLDYCGAENKWRPDEQVRVGADYWKALYVNNTFMPWWVEIWSGLFWQSANEFDKDYDSVILGNAVRFGVRKPNEGILSTFSPYVLVESSLTDNKEYFWENKLVAGIGIRFAPLLYEKRDHSDWLTRLVIFAEYLDVVDYYRTSASSSVPNQDFRAGISLNIGEWYR